MSGRMFRGGLVFVAAVLAAAWAMGDDPSIALGAGKVLYDFETAADVAAWSHLSNANKKLPGADEPATTLALATDGVTSGKHALKITYDGGRWPTVTTTTVPLAENWVAAKYRTFKADVTVTRPCLVGFRVLMENRKRDNQYTWAKTEICQPGLNHVSGTLGGWWTGMTPKDGKITGVDIFMFCPHKGESILVDNIRLDTALPPRTAKGVVFKVLGTDMTVPGVRPFGAKMKDKWAAPKANTVEEVEAAFRAEYAELKKTHPAAVLAIFRDGEKGYDPANPGKVYAGWTDTHVNSHGPDSAVVGRAANGNQGWGALEAFMRHRGLLARADFSSIPAGSKILAAQLVLVRTSPLPKKANMYVVEPCNRPWVEKEVNAYEYAKDKYWKSVGGMDAVSYEGDDPDFWPVFAAYGPFGGNAGTWDMTEAMRFWIEQGKPNCGFFCHGDAGDFTKVISRENKDVKKRPAVMVVYEPK